MPIKFNFTEVKISFMICIAFLFNSVVFLDGCSNYNKIDEKKFIKIYVDLLIAKDTTENYATTKDSLRKEIFKRYNVTEKDYKETVGYYNRNPKDWEEFFNKVIAYVGTLKKKHGS